MKLILFTVVLVLSQPALAQSRWGLVNIGGTNGNTSNVTNVTNESGVKEYVAYLEKLDNSKREAINQKVQGRIREMSDVNHTVMNNSSELIGKYSIQYEQICVKDKCTKPEEKISDKDAIACMREHSDQFMKVLQYPEYQALLKKKGVKKISFSLVDNRNSLRSDSMYDIKSEFEPVYEKRHSYYGVPIDMANRVGQCLKNQDESNKEYCDSILASKPHLIPEADYKAVLAKCLSYERQGCAKYIFQKTVAVSGKSNDLKINGFMDATGKCHDISGELAAEFEIMAQYYGLVPKNSNGEKTALSKQAVSDSVSGKNSVAPLTQKRDASGASAVKIEPVK